MKLFHPFLLLCCTTALVFAQKTQPLKFTTDLASFRFDDTKSFVELYYSFSRAGLAFRPTDRGSSASAVIAVSITDAKGNRDPFTRVWRVPVEMEETGGTNDKTVIGKIGFTLEPDRYLFHVVARDETERATVDSLTLPYEVRRFPPATLSLSDIELCTSIQKIAPDTSNLFYKNTLEVIPNPTLLYGASLPNLLYYTELYQNPDEHFLMRAEIISQYGKTMLTRSLRKAGKHPSRVEFGSIPIVGLPSGAYTLSIGYGDTTGVMRLSQSKSFYVFNPSVPLDTAMARETAASIAQEFASLSENELDDAFSMAQYITTKDERALWKELKGAEAKRKFLTKFWDGRDEVPSTPQNEYFINYMKRIRFADEQFRSAYRTGWKTDRGRVYVMYGPPDQIDRPSEGEMKPIEIWMYEGLQSGVKFVFIDKGGFRDYELVHSNHRNEISNPDWEDYLQQLQ